MAKRSVSFNISDEAVISKICVIRGQKVMIDIDLADLYEIEVKRLKAAVRRNKARFPSDFMFQLTQKDWDSLRTQIASLKNGRGAHPKYLPFVFTEQGVAMLSSILNSPAAIKVNIQIIRVFTKMRALLADNKDILLKLEKMENKFVGYDEQIARIFECLRQLLTPPNPPRPRIGFRRKNEEA